MRLNLYHLYTVNFWQVIYFLIEYGIPMKLVRLIKMCLNENYSRVQVGKHLSDMFPIKNDLKQGDALLYSMPLEWFK